MAKVSEDALTRVTAAARDGYGENDHAMRLAYRR